MNVLVVVASRHGATTEIAEAVGRTLRAGGLDVTVCEADHAPELVDVDAVVLGSAVYMGHWLEPARRYAHERAAELARIPVWLFSSGPLGDTPLPGTDPDLSDELAATRALGHKVFPGRLVRDDLRITERTMVRVVHAPEGDFRDWDAVEEWAAQVADQLLHTKEVASG